MMTKTVDAAEFLRAISDGSAEQNALIQEYLIKLSAKVPEPTPEAAASQRLSGHDHRRK